MVDELAGEDDEAPEPQLPPLIEKRGELAGEAGGRRIVLFAGGVKNDARLGGVGHQEPKVRIFGAVQQPLIVLIGVEAAGYAGDHPLAVYLLPVLPPPEEEGVEAVLAVDHGGQARRDRLAEHCLAVKTGLFVHLVNEIVHEGPQEVALAELEYPLRGVFQEISVIALLFQGRVRELFHKIKLLFDSYEDVWRTRLK